MRDLTDLPHVDVVVTHYNDPERLAWVLDALTAQRYPADRLHVVVADDGSAHLPDVPARVRVLTQADEGFRAAAARNMGARAGTAPYLVFLDGDTVPEPDFCARVVAACADDALVVGRRRHANLSALGRAGVAALAAGELADDHLPLLEEPQWLREGYARTRDLAGAGPDDWRYVISAVLALPRAVFTALGGFDASLVGYGGEDWDLAYRAWNAGIALRHVPNAVAWHDGPDAAGRQGFAEAKEHEQLALAERIPQPSVRGHGGVWRQPRTVVRWQVGEMTSSAQHACLLSWLALGDVEVRPDRRLHTPLARDPRVTVSGDDALLARAEFLVEIEGAIELCEPAEFLATLGVGPHEARGVAGARTRDRALGVAARPFAEGILMSLDPSARVDLEARGRRP